MHAEFRGPANRRDKIGPALAVSKSGIISSAAKRTIIPIIYKITGFRRSGQPVAAGQRISGAGVFDKRDAGAAHRCVG